MKELLEIPHIHLSQLYRPVLKEIGERIVHEGDLDFDTLTFVIPGISLKHKVACLHLDFCVSMDRIISNLNLCVSEVAGLPALVGMPQIEKSQRLDLFVRMFFYEIARTEDVVSHFLAGLNRLGRITKREKKEFHQFFYDRLKNVIKGRNTLIHGLTRPAQDEIYLLFYTRYPSLNLENRRTEGDSSNVDLLLATTARKRAIAMSLDGKALAELIQLVFDFMGHPFADGGYYATHPEIANSQSTASDAGSR